MKNTAILINTARGGLVDSAALADALRNGKIAAAAIDVLPEEPPVNGDPLLDYDGNNLLVTPHIAWASDRARQAAIDELTENIAAFQYPRQTQRRMTVANAIAWSDQAPIICRAHCTICRTRGEPRS